jgi:hypothetical protein
MAPVFNRVANEPVLKRVAEEEDIAGELERLREENRRMAVTLGAFSAFIANRGLLEEAWNFVNKIHALDDGHTD